MKVSCIIPTIGRVTLQEAISSALNQHDVAIEILVIDDSESQNISYISPEIKVIKTGGGKGISRSRNLGIKEITGDYVAFLDDDDVWMPNKSIKQIKFIEENNLCGAYSGAIFGKTRDYRPKTLLPVTDNPIKFLYRSSNIFSSNHYLPMSSLIIKSENVMKFEFRNDLSYREDIRFIDDICEHGKNIGQIPEALCIINNNISRSSRRIKISEEVNWALYLATKDFVAFTIFVLTLFPRSIFFKVLFELKAKLEFVSSKHMKVK